MNPKRLEIMYSALDLPRGVYFHERGRNFHGLRRHVKNGCFETEHIRNNAMHVQNGCFETEHIGNNVGRIELGNMGMRPQAKKQILGLA